MRDLCFNPAKQVFDPVLRWAEGELGARLIADDSLTGMDQSEELINNARSYLHGQLTHTQVGAGCRLSCHAAECSAKVVAQLMQIANCCGCSWVRRAGPVAAGSSGRGGIGVSICDSWAGACQGKATQCHMRRRLLQV